jgi:hypothetical protein
MSSAVSFEMGEEQGLYGRLLIKKIVYHVLVSPL